MKYFNESDIVEAKIINLDTHEEITLLDKPNRGRSSKNLFLPEEKEIEFGEFRIRLRFDWGDLDKNGDPTLDVDITKREEKYKTDTNKWHNTYRQQENGLLVYHFKFEQLEFIFKLQLTKDKIITGKARIIKP